jgi:hypothetical protein
MHVGTIMESNDATFFDDIFPMKYMPSSSNQDMPSSSRQELVKVPKTTIPIEHFENHLKNDYDTPKRSERQRTAKSFGNDFIVYLIDDTLVLFQKPMHPWMLIARRKLKVVRWIPS